MRHGAHGVSEFVDDGCGAFFFKDTTCDDAEGIDEFLTVLVVLEQVLEQLYHLDILIIVERREAVSPCIKRIVEIEAYKTEATIGLTAVALDVVFWPVVIAKE